LLASRHNPDGILSVDPKGCIINWNPSMEIISGLHRRDVIGQHWAEVAPWLAGIAGNSYLEGALRGETAFTGAYRYDIPGRHGHFRASCGPLYNAEGQIIGATLVVRSYPESSTSTELPWLPTLATERAGPALALLSASVISAFYHAHHCFHRFDFDLSVLVDLIT
jgi:PAS domain S-box-containing protein